MEIAPERVDRLVRKALAHMKEFFRLPEETRESVRRAGPTSLETLLTEEANRLRKARGER